MRGVVAAAVVVLVVAVASCSSGGSSERVDAGRGVEGSSTTEAARERTSTSTTTAAELASAEGCEELELLVLETAVEPDEERPMPSEAEAREASERLVALVPDQLRKDFGALMTATSADDDRLVGVDVAGLLEEVIAWGAERCPQPVPVWACSVRSTFTPIGEAIGVDGETTGSTGAGGYTTPEEAAGDDQPDDGERTVLAEGEDLTTFGWLDDAGLVTRRLVVERGDDGWQRGADTACRGADEVAHEETFTPIGEAIDPGPDAGSMPEPAGEMTEEELDDLCTGDQPMTDHDWRFCREAGYEY